MNHGIIPDLPGPPLAILCWETVSFHLETLHSVSGTMLTFTGVVMIITPLLHQCTHDLAIIKHFEIMLSILETGF